MRNDASARLHRIELLLGADALRRLAAAHVTVVGLGAVGSFAVEALARSGIGHLRVVDFDDVHESNINRQLYALTGTIGRAKVDVAAERIREINPDCEVETLRCFADSETRADILNGPPDVLIDAIDSVGPKTRLLADAKRAGVPTIVSAMGAAMRTDPTQVRVGDLAETRNCRLAQQIRKNLRKEGMSTGIRCVYSLEPVTGEMLEPEEITDGKAYARGRPRRVLGSMAAITGVYGLVAAREAIMALVSAGPRAG